MRRIIVCALAALVSPTLALAEMSQAAKNHLEQHIAALAIEVATAEREAAGFEPGSLLAVLAQVRSETLALTLAMVEARLVAENTGASFDFVFPMVRPNPEVAERIEVDIIAQEAIIAAAEIDAVRTSGLVQAIAISRVQAEKLTLARLRGALMQARYGAVLPAETVGNLGGDVFSAPLQSSADRTDAPVVRTDALSWADANFPEIDYSAAIFRQLDGEGFSLHGWWGLLETRAEIDDSPRVFGLQVELSASATGFNPTTPGIQISCREGTLAFIYDTDDYLLTDVRRDGIDVTYRIDTDPAVTERWNETTGNEAAGLFGSNSLPFLRKIYGADRLFLRLVERGGERHDATFNLAGIRPVLEAATTACRTSLLALSQDEYRAIQEMLNAAGYDSGTPDGVWGAGSMRALEAFQTAEGLPATGTPDAVTLRAMGLDF